MVDVINPNITASIGTQSQVNPLAMLGQYAQVQNQLLQGQYVRSKQAAGALYQQSIGPDGTPDLDKFTTLLASHPETALAAPEVLNQMSQMKMINAETTRVNLDSAAKRLNIVGQIAANAAQPESGVTKGEDLMPYISDMDAAGAFPDGPSGQKAIAWTSQMMQYKGPELQQHLLQFAKSTIDGAQRIQDLNGDFVPNAVTNPDGSTQGAWRSRLRGTIAGPGQVPGIAGPQAAMSAGPTQGANALTAPGASTQTAQANPLAPQATSAAPIIGGQLSPVRQAQLAGVGDYVKNVNERTTQSQQLLINMQQARDVLQNFKTGGGMGAREQLGRLADAVGAGPEVKNQIAGGSLADLQTAQQMLFNIAAQKFSQIAHATGGRLAASIETKILSNTPNVDQTPEAMDKELGAMKQIADLTLLEKRHMDGRLATKGYDPVNVQEDWSNLLQATLAKPSGQGGQQ